MFHKKKQKKTGKISPTKTIVGKCSKFKQKSREWKNGH